MSTKKLSEVQTVIGLADNEYIPVILADGSVGKIKKSDLLPLATLNNSGLMSAEDKNYMGKYVTRHKLLTGDKGEHIFFLFSLNKKAGSYNVNYTANGANCIYSGIFRAYNSGSMFNLLDMNNIISKRGDSTIITEITADKMNVYFCKKDTASISFCLGVPDSLDITNFGVEVTRDKITVSREYPLSNH